MKLFTLSIILFLSIIPGFAQQEDPYRTFRDREGRSIRAVVVRAADDAVWIRREDGQTFRVALETLSKTDQNFVSHWRITDALKAPNALEFSVTRFSDGRESTTTTSRNVTTTQYGYAVTLENRTAFDLENLEIEYRYFALRGSSSATGQDRKRERFSGQDRIAVLPSLGKASFETPTVPLVSSSLRADRTSTQRRTRDDLGGIWIRIMHDRKLIAELSSPLKLAETEDW